jgi:hypothetical protein
VRAAAVALALIATASAAHAEVFRDADRRFELELPAAWTKDSDALLWRNSDTDQVMVVTRIDGPTSDAWRGRRSFFDAVEKGVRDSADSFKSLRRRRGKAGRVPTLDLWFQYRATDGADVTVAMRFLFFRRYTLSLAIDTPAKRFRKHRRAVRKLTKSFKPYFPKKK